MKVQLTSGYMTYDGKRYCAGGVFNISEVAYQTHKKRLEIVNGAKEIITNSEPKKEKAKEKKRRKKFKKDS